MPMRPPESAPIVTHLVAHRQGSHGPGARPWMRPASLELRAQGSGGRRWSASRPATSSTPRRLRTTSGPQRRDQLLRRSLNTVPPPAAPKVSRCSACPRVTVTPPYSPADRARSGHAHGSGDGGRRAICPQAMASLAGGSMLRSFLPSLLRLVRPRPAPVALTSRSSSAVLASAVSWHLRATSNCSSLLLFLRRS